MKTKPFVSVDADTLVFSAAVVTEKRSIEVTHKPTGKSKKFSNRTEFKEIMKAKEKKITDDYYIKDIQQVEDISHTLKLIKNSVEQVLDNFSDCEVVFCATAENNFRNMLHYPTPYKGNRKNLLKPILLKDAQQYLLEKYKAHKALGCEVDDYTAIIAYEAISQGREAFLLSPDGDSRQFDGLKLGNYNNKPSECIDIQFMHSIDYTDKGFQSYGFPWLIMQAAVGDMTDGLNPSYLCNKRYGEKGHFNAVKDFTTKDQHAQYLIDLYQKWYPSEFEYLSHSGEKIKADWKFMLELYWKGTTMMRKHNEEPDVWKFFKDHDITYSFNKEI